MKIKIKKVVDMLECASSSGKLPKPLKTQDCFYTVCECVKRLLKGERVSFVQLDVKDFFARCGFPVKEEGIGWRIEI